MVSRIFFIIIGLVTMIYIYIKVKSNKMNENESIFWMIGSVAIFILSLFPKSIDVFANLLNIDYPPSMLFMLSIVFICVLVFRLTIHISKLQQQVKELAQRNCILEEIIRGNK